MHSKIVMLKFKIMTTKSYFLMIFYLVFLDDGRGIGVTVYAGVWFEFEESHAAPLGWADKVPLGISVLKIFTYTFIRKITQLCLIEPLGSI